MSIPTLYTPINNAQTTLTAAHVVGDNQLTVLNASAFGSPSANSPVRVTCVRLSDQAEVIFAITGSNLSTNVLTIGSILENTTDIALAINDLVLVRVTAGTIGDIHTYLAKLDNTKYIFTQNTPVASWTITHNLGHYPAVTVVDSAGSVVIGDIIYNSNNQVTVNFSAGFAGAAYLN